MKIHLLTTKTTLLTVLLLNTCLTYSNNQPKSTKHNIKILSPSLKTYITSDSTLKSKPKKETNILRTVDEVPEFPGGINELRKYISTNLIYPEIAKKNSITGKVFVQFVINEKGGIEQTKVVRGVDSSLNKEAVRVIKSMPLWKPGKVKGKPVKGSFTLPIKFPFD